MSERILLVTLPPTTGGVPTKTKILARFLRRLGHQVTIAHYATLSDDPALVVPSWRMFATKPGITRRTCFDDFPSIAVGCRFPELEFSYYRRSDAWRRVVGEFDRHIAVGGTVLVANLLMDNGFKFPVWCASTMIDDRAERRAAMPWPRRLVDETLIGPVQRGIEKRVLATNAHFMAVSQYAADTLIDAGGRRDRFRTVPVPVDTALFRPDEMTVARRIGFAGRPEDPRKNLPLLLRAVSVLRSRGTAVTLHLTGEPPRDISRLAIQLGIEDVITWTGWMPEHALPDFFRSLDVFVFPSAKEGLGISGIQAMASGVPVVSTRCGGPEDYVIDGETGALVEAEPRAMADAIAGICEDRLRRERLGTAARALMEREYAMARFEDNIAEVWQSTWGDRLSPSN